MSSVPPSSEENPAAFLQGIEAKNLEVSVDGLISRAADIRKSIENFLYKIENEHNVIEWPTMLDSFALLSGQITTMLSAMKSEKMVPLRNFPIVPLKLSQDPDPNLLKLTMGRVACMSHAEVPDYLRTKPDPAVEQAERQMLATVSSVEHTPTAQAQVTQFNKQLTRVGEKVRNARANSKSGDAFVSRSAPATFNNQATLELIAAINFGHGLKASMKREMAAVKSDMRP